MAFARSTLAVLSFLLAVAADSTTTSATPGSFTIPTDISADCTSFLTSLDTDQGLTTCISSVLAATTPFNTTAGSFTAAQVSAAFDTLCNGATAACSADAFRPQLTDFGVKCAADLATSDAVAGLYDMLYTLPALQQALCVRDATTNDFCATQAGTVGNNTLSLTDDTAQTVLAADLADLGAASVPFLFVMPDSDQTVLCSQCFKDVLQVYITYEDSCPYAMGVNQSPMLKNQAQLWTAFQANGGGQAASNVAVQAGAAPQTPNAAPKRAVMHAGMGVGAALLVAVAAL